MIGYIAIAFFVFYLLRPSTEGKKAVVVTLKGKPHLTIKTATAAQKRKRQKAINEQLRMLNGGILDVQDAEDLRRYGISERSWIDENGKPQKPIIQRHCTIEEAAEIMDGEPNGRINRRIAELNEIIMPGGLFGKK